VNLAQIDLNLFLVFEVIYTEGNLTRASEILHVTQPAVSNALARLRQTLGDPLFVRSGRSMVPTPAAQNLIGPVREAMRQLQGGIATRARFDPATANRVFHLAMRDLTASLVMPTLMRRLRERAPQLRLQCHELERREAERELAAGKLDFAIDSTPLGRGRLNGLPLLHGDYVCVMRRGHPLGRRALTLERYLALPQVTVSGRERGLSYIDLALGRIGAQANTVLRLPHYQPAFHVVLSSDLALSAPRSLAAWYDVEVKELPFEVPRQDSQLYWHLNAEHDPAHVWLRGQIVEACRAEARLSPRSRRRPPDSSQKS
jgi:DNA-binding transcriptional LysR family regulator